MKRSITILIILILLGAAIFSVGYLPIRLHNGHVAIFYSKTSGWDRSPVTPGEFAWRWELLIPTNVTLHQFSDETRTLDIRSISLLPSADLYGPLLEGTPSLTQNMRFRIRYRFTPEEFSRSAPRGMRPENADRWYQDRDDEIRSAAVIFAGSAVLDLVEQVDIIVPIPAVADRILDQLQTRFPDLDIQAVVIETLELPDPGLYILGRDTYRTVQAAREESLIEAARAVARTQATADQRAAMLQQYGRIFSEYPILLEYLEISARTGRDPLSIEALPQIQAAVP